MPFLYYQFLKYLGILLILCFVGLVALCVFLHSQNRDLEYQVLKLKQEKQDAFINNEHRPAAPPREPVAAETTPVPAPATGFVVDEIDSQLVEIRDFTIDLDNRHPSVQFNLVNISNPNRPINGYLFVALMDNLTSENHETLIPSGNHSVSLQEIKDVKQGDSFSIKYFKMINYDFTKPDHDVRYVWFRIYSRHGNVIYQTVKSVDNDK